MVQAAVVRMNPNWSFLESNFEVLAKELFRQASSIGFGRVSANYGTIHDHHTHTDLFSPERIESTGPYRSMEQRGLTVNGPIPFTNTEERAFAARCAKSWLKVGVAALEHSGSLSA
eukprot:1144237-Pelagomonas_calceolata.AAC.3